MSRNLRTVVGVDEAGYGPRLGPLVVGVAAFRIPAGARLGELLPSTAPGGAVPVSDSKRIYRGGEGLDRLERAVLAFRERAAAAEVPDRPGESPPWGLRWPPRLPAAVPGEALAPAREALARDLRASGVSVLALRTRTVGVAELNRGIAETDSKAAVLFRAAAQLFGPWLREPGETRIDVDHHGGRVYYSELLAERFPESLHFVLEERRDRSAYRFEGAGGETTVTFEVKADDRHLAVALASMAAKYVRELHMRALNDWFGAEDPDLTPTAGYWEDGTRWLAETEELRARLGVRDDALVRRR